ncbi:retrovirus-related pol polyprotein from transposon TNT 1-94 [Tanacetum coccineum]
MEFKNLQVPWAFLTEFRGVLLCERFPKVISAINLLCASLKIITAIEFVFEKCGIANLDVGFSGVEVKGLFLGVIGVAGLGITGVKFGALAILVPQFVGCYFTIRPCGDIALRFFICAVDPTLFTWKEGKDILLVQNYVDDIIFASTDPALCETFSEIMCSKFKMSMMGKMSFFLGLQISQSPRGIFLNQSKYALEIIKKYEIESSDPVDTPMVEKSKLDADPQGKEVDPTHYRGMIGSLMYLTSSRPDLVFVVCMCARTEYQLADIFTKVLRRERLEFLINKLGMRSMSPETLKRLAEKAEE